MKTLLTLTLISLQLLGYSQKANIDLNNQTVLLDKEKTIQVAKIIKNEDRLRSRVKELNSEIEKLSDSITYLVTIYKESLNKINNLNESIYSNSDRINSINDANIDVLRKNKPYGIYLSSIYSYNGQGNILAAGITYVRKKTIYSAHIDVANQKNNLIFSFGFKLF